MRVSTLRLPGGGTAAGYHDRDDIVVLPYTDVVDLLSSGDDWPTRAMEHDGQRIPAATVELATLVPRPDKIVCLGLNYATHVCPERRSDGDVEDPQHEACCAGDGGRSSGFAEQAENSNHRSAMPVKSRGGKRLRRRLAISGSGEQREDEQG